MPLISIIVPVYNSVDYLDQCLDSLINQTLKDIEVVCIDDGSTDGSASALDRWQLRDPRIRVLHQANAGVSAARNVGLDCVSGDYVLFVDSDDYIELNTCQRLLETAQRDNADIVVFGGQTFPSVGWIDKTLSTPDTVHVHSSMDALFCENGSYPLMCNKLYRMAFLSRIEARFNTELELGEDHAFQLCVFPFANVVSFMSDMFYHYRCGHSGSALTTFYSDEAVKLKKHLAVVAFVCSEWERLGLLKSNGSRLLLWASCFFTDDLSRLPYDLRREFSKSLSSLLDRYGVERGDYNEFDNAVIDFALGHPASYGMPKLSIVMWPQFSGTVTQERVLSLCGQSYQNIELYYVADEMDDSFSNDELKELDSRIVIVDSLEEALGRSSSEYILCADPTFDYGWDYARQMIISSQQSAACVTACVDSRDLLRIPPMLRFLHTKLNGNLRASGHELDSHEIVFSPTEASERSYQSMSLAYGNKLIKRNLMTRMMAEFGAFTVVPACIKNAHVLSLLPERLIDISRHCLDVNFNAIVAKVAQTLDGVAGARESLGSEREIETSLCDAMLGILAMNLDRLPSFQLQRNYAEMLRKSLTSNGLLSEEEGIYLNHLDWTWLHSVLSNDASFGQGDYLNRFVDVEDRLGAALREVDALNRELVRINESITMKVGCALVKVPRKAVNLLRKLHG